MTDHAIHWIVTYPVDSGIHPLNNWGQVNEPRVICIQSCHDKWLKMALASDGNGLLGLSFDVHVPLLKMFTSSQPIPTLN